MQYADILAELTRKIRAIPGKSFLCGIKTNKAIRGGPLDAEGGGGAMVFLSQQTNYVFHF